MITKFSDSKIANDMSEPIIPSLFEFALIPHPALKAMPIALLKEQIKSVGGFDAFEKVPELISQTFGPGTRRLFPGVQVDTVVELSTTFNVNLQGANGTEATTFITLKRMKDLQFNRASGARGLKANCVFKVIVQKTNKVGGVWAVAKMDNCLFGGSGITGLDEVNIESDDAATLSCTFISDKNSIQYAAQV